jgi:glucose-1-phosphate cytidylyltransferase
MKVIILCGGLGTRLREETELRPKPMVEVGGRPLLWHIMKHYGHYGFDDFVIALGYKGDVIKRYFLEYHAISSDVTVCLRTGGIEIHDGDRENWTVHLVETGLTTQTGGRLKRLAPWIGNEAFMLTYGDGVSDVNLPELLAFHQPHGRLATVTAVRPPARFGEIVLADRDVVRFSEKPQVGEGWINGGFMVCEPGVLSHIANDDSSLERDALEQLASKQQLAAYRHAGFWQSMDTMRDVRVLETHWHGGHAPWAMWAS